MMLDFIEEIELVLFIGFDCDMPAVFLADLNLVYEQS